MNNKILFAKILLFLTLFSAFSLRQTNAQQIDSSGYTINIPVAESVQAGDVICQYNEGFKKCITEYDTSIYGIVVENPSISLIDEGIENGVLVATNGIAEIKISSIDGNIKEGDLITSSSTAGVGKKMTRNGYVIGSAMESYESDNPNNIGKIQLIINVHPAAGFAKGGTNLLKYIRDGLAVPLLEPLESLRYLLAILMVLISFTMGMIYFGKSSRAGIEAIGRNPLAKKVIQLTVLMNIVLTVVIVLVGLGIAYLILVL